MPDVRAAVADAINKVLTDSGRPAREFADDDTLTGTIGLDSLDLAVMVVTLEQTLGVDPFRSGGAVLITHRAGQGHLNESDEDEDGGAEEEVVEASQVGDRR